LTNPRAKIIYAKMHAITKMTRLHPKAVMRKSPRILSSDLILIEQGKLAKLGQALRKWEPYEVKPLQLQEKWGEFCDKTFTVIPVALTKKG